MEKKYDLDQRLIDFASECFDISESLPKTFAGKHISNQLIRSSSPHRCIMEKHKLPKAVLISFTK